MKLFLSGGGTNEDSILIDTAFARAVDRSKALLYLPIAIDQKKNPYHACFDFIRGVFNPLGIKDIVMWTEADLRRDNPSLRHFSGIYIGGGNTFYLLKELKETGIFQMIIDAVKNGIPYYGGSAGAIICGRSIETASLSDKNNVNLSDLSGMRLLKDYSILCHYNHNRFNSIIKLASKKDASILALPEDSGLYVDQKEAKVIGKGPSYKITCKGSEIRPGETLSLI